MRHGIAKRKLNRTSSHRKAMFANMAVALVQHEQIKTTLPKAKDLRPIVEKLVTLARKKSLNNNLTTFRQLLAKIKDQEAVKKLIDKLAVRYADRAGGYLRIYKAGFRYGDMAPMAIIEFVDRDVNALGKNFNEQHPVLEIVA